MGKASNGNGKLKRGVIENRAVDLALCDAHERNYNRHSDAQIADLRESLRHFGQVRSIVAQQNGKRFLLVAGHGLAQAARLEGFTELRADIIPASWSKTRVLAYLAADNEIARQGSADEAQLAAIVREVMDAEGEALARLAAGEQSALERLLAGTPDFQPVGIDEQGRLDEKKKVKCPNCGNEFTP